MGSFQTGIETKLIFKNNKKNNRKIKFQLSKGFVEKKGII